MNLVNEFVNVYGSAPQYSFFCPGRVNLIGEHIDYNGGLVMPCAIALGTHLLITPNDENIFRFKSLNFEEAIEIPVAPEYEKTGKAWYNYPLGVIDLFTRAGKKLSGLNMLFVGNVPIGSGLSSSAAIEVATAFALNTIFDIGYDKLDLVKYAQQVENKFIGVNCGIMDQFAVAFGEKDSALVLNCDTLAYEAVPCGLDDYVLAIINTNKQRTLADSKYNERFAECRSALKNLQTRLPIQHLCDLNANDLEHNLDLIENFTIAKRAKHVVNENERVHAAVKALSDGQLEAFGELMYASHDSLRNLYEVTGKELDCVIDFCKTQPHVVGARMTGAGFGGCAIALVKKAHFDDFEKKLTWHYTDMIGYAPSVYMSEIGNGVYQLNYSNTTEQECIR
ncbi:galactokinase [Solitalea koreensis]|uniref:Galactokinase n=1 Tax=Solitalea koreensis TaxID=543615 RepID=A0A521AGL1_9SPHI|nr:galactokinase [Solitalea koreensis]SMO33840.1 galactokinase [Solitalea koreensis]